MHRLLLMLTAPLVDFHFLLLTESALAGPEHDIRDEGDLYPIQ